MARCLYRYGPNLPPSRLQRHDVPPRMHVLFGPLGSFLIVHWRTPATTHSRGKRLVKPNVEQTVPTLFADV